jgi:P-type Ca2+ transporter type 2C
MQIEKENPKTPWSEPLNSLVDYFKADTQIGLTKDEAEKRLKLYGPNALREPEKTPKWKRFLAQLKSPVVITLLIATVVSALLGEMVDAIAILTIVLINSIIGYFQEAKAEAAVEALKKSSAPKARILRSGVVYEITSEDIVAGDILVFEAGDLVAADARLFEANQLFIDESLLTGESLPVAKRLGEVGTSTPLADRSNMIFSGTAISTGTGKAIVTAIGMNTQMGNIALLIESAKTQKTPLQIRLEEVGSKLLILCLVVVALVALLGVIHGERWLDVLMTAISLAVAAIPEGLPAVVTLALALAIRRLTKKKAIVRNLPAVETLGSTGVICTDKTGTLTTGKMQVREVVTPTGLILETNDIPLMESVVLCSNASISESGESTGDPTEVALLHLAKKHGHDIGKILKEKKRLYEWSFESIRKRMSVAVSHEGQIFIHVKGAPESVLPLCHIKPEVLEKINDSLLKLSNRGHRILAVARGTLKIPPKDFRSSDFLEFSHVERDLTFLGLVAMADPPRPETKDAVLKCKASGILVVMITGDHPITAKAIARELGIIEPKKFDGVLTGAEIDQLSDFEFEKKIEHTAVYARVAPEHKIKIVNAWKAKGMVVAMTGDGVNDAPALKAASIGVSMGKGGTEVARAASAMVLADDNFATIVGAVEEGRAIYGNIRRTIQYLLSSNLGEVLIMLGAAVMGWPTPLMPIHLLWINLVTDGMPSLALAAEPVPKDILQSSPRPSPKNFFDKIFYQEMVLIGFVIAAFALAIYGYTLKTQGLAMARTYVFCFFVFEELFRSFACRSETKNFFQLGIFSNNYHLLAVCIPLILQILVVEVDWFGDIFKIQKISWNDGLILLALTLVPTTILETRKWFKNKK